MKVRIQKEPGNRRIYVAIRQGHPGPKALVTAETSKLSRKLTKTELLADIYEGTAEQSPL